MKKLFIALDSTHKLISCRFLFTAIVTSTMDQEISGITYMVHAKDNTETHVFGLNTSKESSKKKNLDYKPMVIFIL